MNKTIWAALVLLVLAVGIYWLSGRNPAAPADTYSVDPLNGTYSIELSDSALTNGAASEVQTSGKAGVEVTLTKTTRIFGSPVLGDLSGDGKTDAAIILTQNQGGSGTFYYVAAAINSGSGTQGTNAVLLGDRIAPQTLEVKDGKIIANYADRAPGQAYAEKPTVGITKYFAVQDGVLVEVK